MNYIKPITYSITFGLDDLKDYIQECQEDGKFVSQAGWEEYVQNQFDYILQEAPNTSPYAFDRKFEDINHNVDAM